MAQLSNTVINNDLSVNGDASGEGIINLIYLICEEKEQLNY